MNTTIPATILIDEALRTGSLWLEDGELHLKLPTSAKWLFDEIRERRNEVITECMHRWMRPGVPYQEWVRNGRLQ